MVPGRHQSVGVCTENSCKDCCDESSWGHSTLSLNVCSLCSIMVHGMSPLLMQEHPEYATLRSTLQHLVRTQGVSGLWAGIVPRAGRISCAVIILQSVRSKLISLAEEMKSGP